jgi:DNA-binding transcriptional MerR regulator
MLIYVIMNRLLSIGEVSETLGVSITMLRRWEKIGRIKAEHIVGGHHVDSA